MIKVSLIQKITFSGLLLALTIICTRIIAIQNLPVIPFVRVSLGPALIILSSLLLGPVCGAVVGAGSDILGIVLFPNTLGYSINPLFTIIYGLLGILPWLIYFLIKKVKKPKFAAILNVLIFALLWIFLLIFLLTNNSVVLFNKTYEFEIWHKALILSLSFVLTIVCVLAIHFTNKMIIKKFPTCEFETYKISFVCLVCELVIMLILNSIVKTLFFEVDFLFIFFAQAVVFFIDVPLNTIVVTYLMLLINRILVKRS